MLVLNKLWEWKELLVKLSMFKVTFLSIILEAMPFILIGSLISSIINEYVSEQTIQKYLPKNRFFAIVTASFMGLIFPVCECAIVPIIRRLMKKGIPIYVAIPFMVSVPIINPIVLFSTYIAFQGSLELVWMRALMGLVAAWALGLILSFADLKNEELLRSTQSVVSTCGCGEEHHINLVQFSIAPKRKIPVPSILRHTTSEFYDVGKLLIMGATLSALFKSFVPRALVMGLGQNEIGSILVMMGLAFVLSLCSEADAFIARTFTGVFSTGSILSFLVLGPMIDIKNFMMLSGTFKNRFVTRLTALIFALVFIMSSIVNII